MAKYKYVITFDDGEEMDSYEMDEELFDSEEEAYDAAEYAVSCTNLGAEIDHMSNPGDYPDEDCGGTDIEIVQIE